MATEKATKKPVPNPAPTTPPGGFTGLDNPSGQHPGVPPNDPSQPYSPSKDRPAPSNVPPGEQEKR